MGSDGGKPAVAQSDVDGERSEGVKAAEPEAGRPADVPERAKAATGAGSRRVLVGLGAAVLVLAIAVAAVVALFARERSAHDDTRRALRAEAARAAQVDRDLAAVRAERAEIEKKLATAEAQLLSPEAKLAIVNCVKAYAMIERTIGEAGGRPVTVGSVEIVVVPDGQSVASVCAAAEPHLAKLG